MNMKYNLKHLLIAGFVALGLSSCDGFLNVMPSDALTTENAINNIDDVNAVLNGVYQSLLNEEYYGNDFIARAEMGGDDVQPTMEGKSRTDNWYRFMYRVNNSPEGLWYYPYKAISRANTLIDVIESGKIEASEELNIAKGEALAVRALCHFNLTITYGYPYQKDNGASYGVPLGLDVPTASDMPSRSSVEQCYAAIEQDLEDALDYLKNDTLVTEGHFNKWAVLGLQARVALYKGDYETAFSKASEVIEKGPYALIDHADYVTSWAEEFTTESVFDLYISALSQGNRELIGYLVDTNGYGEYAVTDEFLDYLGLSSLEQLPELHEVEVEEEVIEEEAIPFQLVEEKPKFNGGDQNEFSKWVAKNLEYPEIAKENGVQGRVTLQFTVEKDGSVTKVKVLRGVDPSLDKEAVRVVSQSPKWKPGKQRDRAVPVTYTFPVIFQLR